jgi:DNA-binding LytR/AlgR family response regulator
MTISEQKIKISGNQLVLQSEILYLESILNYTCIHTLQKQHVSSRTLKKFSTRVDASLFVRINRGLMVNAGYVKEINCEKTDPSVRLSNGKILPISRRKYSEALRNLRKLKALN